jgi:quercetin dioxygenase-like cupin family protein
MTSSSHTKPYHLVNGEGPALWHFGGLVSFKATSDNTHGQLWLQEVTGCRGYASPLHRHTLEDEAFYILEGELSIHIGNDMSTAGPGDFLWAPRDIAHAFCVESDQARFLAMSTASQFDKFFFATGEPALTMNLPPLADGSPDIDTLVAALARHGVEMIGPPPTPRII